MDVECEVRLRNDTVCRQMVRVCGRLTPIDPYGALGLDVVSKEVRDCKTIAFNSLLGLHEAVSALDELMQYPAEQTATALSILSLSVENWLRQAKTLTCSRLGRA
jgi:hypothetical protein